MLRVELRALDKEDLVLEEKGWAAALGIEVLPEMNREPLEVYCHLSKVDDLVTAKGWVKGKMLLACGRCLKDFESGYKSFFEVRYRRARPDGAEGEEGVGEGDAEIVHFEGDSLDLAEQVRQTVLLSMPMRALCRDDCKGLCPGCGRDLNVEPCGCSGPPNDPRWDALTKLKL
jgi:DUF177 domain-containing protein